MISSTVRLLECLDLDNAVSQLLSEAVHEQNDISVSLDPVLLFLVCTWSSAVAEGLQLGVPLLITVSVISEGLHTFSEEVDCLHIHIHRIFDHRDSAKTISRLGIVSVYVLFFP
jgi:hypothetical protein